jgi:hypothetical protein
MEFITELTEDVGRHIVGFLDIPTIVKKKVVCRSWRVLFTNAIEQKRRPYHKHSNLATSFEFLLKSMHNINQLMRKLLQQHMDGPSGGGTFPTLRILRKFFMAKSLSTKALDRGT